MPNPTRGQVIDESIGGDNARLINQHIELSHNSLVTQLPTNLPSSRVGIAETMPRIFVNGSIQPTTNHWNATAIYLPKDQLVTGITFFSGNTALSVGVHQWFGVWDSALALWGGSADDTSAAWGSNAAKRLPLTTPKTTTYAGLYYVGLEITATTVPAIAGMQNNGTVYSQAIRTLTPKITVIDTTTAVTSLAPTLADAAAALGSLYAVLD